MSISAGSALKLAFTCEPSQNGIVLDCPQRHNAIFEPAKGFSVPCWVNFAVPDESRIMGPLAKSRTFTKSASRTRLGKEKGT